MLKQSLSVHLSVLQCLQTAKTRHFAVQVHHPLQQGLRHQVSLANVVRNEVQVHHPLQQGLRQQYKKGSPLRGLRTSASSITTRIKTRKKEDVLQKHTPVQVHHPLQQGLRLIRDFLLSSFVSVQVHHPLQQGLRQSCTR